MTQGWLEGRTALVTGGATGMGRAISESLSGAGARVAIGSLAKGANLNSAAYAHLPDDDEIGKAVAAIKAQGGDARAFPLDLRDEQSVDAFHQATVEALGPVDILINAAGVSAQALITDDDSDGVWQTVLDINLNGPYRTIRRCFPGMIERGWGRIVNIASTAANVGHERNAAYCASKHGLLGLMRCVALEGAPHGVTCNAINPGSVGTGMMKRGSEIRASLGQGGDWEENFGLTAQAMPQGRLITVEEIAATALFLCRDEARGITMEDIDIAGGALW
ncbi:MAG: SDR family oxidoreductase [Rhodospirillaceae bacterium]|nr:SDR family oxidoreductase [Rhodospirillaceae bacterium]MBT6204983.1 SDR family oxidoreductase [Rhodospirillaceae bacterium]MBT6511231.1 SDR family oxidoreductase [Rhodospirillaceae bacterium]MBT7647246.1 SDR family oxidoreductase [Rhodospirillaceae bacterium]